MTIAAARKFIVKASREPEWVQMLNTSESASELNSKLADADLVFSYVEFDEAYNNILTKCQFHAQADALEQIRNWYDLLLMSFNE